jgi:hypothetical protein
MADLVRIKSVKIVKFKFHTKAEILRPSILSMKDIYMLYRYFLGEANEIRDGGTQSSLGTLQILDSKQDLEKSKAFTSLLRRNHKIQWEMVTNGLVFLPHVKQGNRRRKSATPLSFRFCCIIASK